MLKGYLRGCPRCGGDVFVEEDPFLSDSFLGCLQCGHTLTGAEEHALLAARRHATSAA